MMKRILYIIIPALAFLLSCEDKDLYNVKFNYQTILDKEYRFNVGRVVPITIDQTIETDGDISRDGKFFYYSSNSDGGNFDIYLRSMTDITTVRMTSHPSKDITPAVSPNGKKLAFVSFREDPEGDIFIMDIKPGGLIKKQDESISALSSQDNSAKNISIEKEKESGVIINIKDTNPAWSPDGNRIVYSSARGGISNLWTMKPNGSDKKQITEKGGQYPSYSMDGNKIVFVSYRENVNGDIYTLDLNSGEETKITTGNSIKLYPSFMSESDKIIYSSIEADTNGNGAIDLKDRSILRFINTGNKLSYSLTKKSDTSFKAKWLPVLATRDYSGIIIYTDVTGENINLNIIPETGIIPKKNNAKLQYEICDTFLTEYEDVEKYLLSLESVYNLYFDKKDNSSRAYVNRALEESALYYKNNGNNAEAKRIISLLQKSSVEKDPYASFILDLIGDKGISKGVPDIQAIVQKFGAEKNSKYLLPFALEDLSDIYFEKGDAAGSLKILKYISANHSDYDRITDINTKISITGDDLRKTDISEAAAGIINKGNVNQKISIIKNLIAPFSKNQFSSSEASAYLERMSSLKLKYKDEKKILAVLSYISGLLYDVKGSTEKSREELLASITQSHPNDITFYLSNIKLGEIERRQSRVDEAEKYFSAGINKYARRFKTENFKERVLWLLNYYEQAGERFESSKKFKNAAETYSKLIDVVTLIHNKRLYPEIYREYAPKAHILYIDSYTSWKGEESIIDIEKIYNEKLPVFRMDFDKAGIYGLGYIYTKKALYLNSLLNESGERISSEAAYESFKMADKQIDWALFIDDTFIDPYILKSWIYQFIDLERNTTDGDIEKYAGKFFPKHLWEENIAILEKALNANDEKVRPENEGNIHLNTANNYFLLLNYPRALKSYKLAEKYKKKFGSEIENALFHFHLGYSLWQNGEVKDARVEIKKAFDIYSSLSAAGGSEKYKYQYLTLYRYFALFSRYENKYSDAIDWYKKILKFAGDNKLTIDKARYFQEMAYCYMKTGKIDSAKYNLDRAATLLEKYPDDEKKYNLKMTLFGIIPLKFNMGPDSVVIGDNRIFYPLDTGSKKLLNLSLYEEIAVTDSDYTTAAKILKEKIIELEKSSTGVALDSRIRAINNLGFYSYISGKYSDAEKYFNQAGDLAESGMNLDGIKASMMNLVNLYAVMIEDNRNSSQEWNKKITKLISKIDSYRKNYYNYRLSEEKDSLKEEAKAKQLEVTEEQIAEVTTMIEQETVSIYYTLDISSSILKYYLAEITYASELQQNSKDLSKAEDLYNLNRDVFNLYKDALKNFDTAITEADNSGRKELKAKLLLNAASCYERTGDIENAYVSLLDAKSFSEQNSLSWIKINTYHKLGNFLNTHGREVEKGEASQLAEKYFTSAISSIEEYPALYSSYSNRIRIIYKDYINFLIDKGSEKRAFEAADRYAQTARILSINSLAPSFSNDYDLEKYYEYSAELGKLNSLRNSMSALQLAGTDPLSADFISLKKSISQKEEKLESLSKVIRSSNSLIKSYVEISAYKEPSINNDIYRFHETEKGLFYWKMSRGKMTSGYVKDEPGTVIAAAGSPVVILLSDTVVDLINSGKLKPSADLIFINTLDRISGYSKDSNLISGNIYSEINGLKGELEEGINITEGKNKSFGDYSLIVDKTGTGNDITPEMLFSSTISPACIIQAGIQSDYQSLSLLMEAAYYAGTKRVIAASGTDSKIIFPLVKRLSGGKDQVSENPFFVLGYINTFNDKIVIENKQIHDEYFSAFSVNMKNADFQKAKISLSKWNSLQKEKNSLVYIKNLWMIELLSGRNKESFDILDTYKALNDEEKNTIKLLRAYTYFYSGNIKSSEKEISGLTETNSLPDDIKLFTAMIKLIKESDSASAEILASVNKQGATVIPSERYLIPAAEFLYLVNDGRSVKLSSLISEKAFLSEGEHLIRYIISGVKPPEGRSNRFNKAASVWTIKDPVLQRDEALKMIRGKDGIDSISIYPVLGTIIRHEGKDLSDELMQFVNSINLSGIIAKSGNLTSVMLLKKIDNFLSRGDRYEERVPVLKEMLDISIKNSFNSIKKDVFFDSAINYYQLQNFDESYKSALSTEELINPEDKNYTDMQLLRMNLYTKAGKYKEAGVKGNILGKIENLSPDRKYMLNLQLSLIELNRLRSLKNAAIADAAEFEKFFSSALSLVKHNTELLNRRGYKEITGEIFDEYINYKMKTGQHSDAHYYNEIKKLLLASSKSGSNLIKYAGTIDMAAVQQILPENGLYVNIAKNKNDLFVWAADRKSKKAFVIENAYPSILKTINDYNSLSAIEKDLAAVSKETAKNLSTLYPLMKNKKMILISTDSETEKIPFEIVGDGDMLSDKTMLLYVPSLLLTTAGDNSISREVYLPEFDNSANSYLSEIAIKESGIKFNSKAEANRGMIYISPKIFYNQFNRDYMVNNKSLKNFTGKSSLLNASSDSVKETGVTDFLLYARELNFQAALMNGSSTQDTNNALFIEEFYRNAGKGVSIQNSFNASVKKVKSTSRYSHPSNWSGYRLNIYNLNLLK